MRYGSIAWLAAGLWACDEAGSLVVVDGEEDLPGADDTDTGSDDVDDTGGDDLTPSGDAPWHHVMRNIQLLPSEEGVDLDGDGTPDNALGFIAGLIPGGGDAGDALARADEQLILQTWRATPRPGTIGVGVLRGIDSDEDPSNNYDGETFLIDGQLRPNGRAMASQATPWTDEGDYEVELPPLPIDLGFIQIPTAIPWQMLGSVDEDTHEGILGTAVSSEAIRQILQANGLGFLREQVAGLADLDTTNDGNDDAISLAVTFTAVPCEVEPLD